jgi:hypothetical protein
MIEKLFSGVWYARIVDNELFDFELMFEIIKNTGYYPSSFILSIQSKSSV